MSEIVVRAKNLGKKYRTSHQRERQRYVALRDVLTDKLLSPGRWLKSLASNRNGLTASNSAAGGRPKNEEFWALKGISFEVKQGESLGIIGRNGAGKSTFMKVLAGAYQHDRGEIRIDGEPVSIASPHDAMRRGISIIYQ